MIGTSAVSKEPMRVKCIHRYRLASSWSSAADSAAAGRALVVAIAPPLACAALDKRYSGSPQSSSEISFKVAPAGWTLGTSGGHGFETYRPLQTTPLRP